MEKEERERQELEANGRREEQSPRERSVPIPPRRKCEGQREEVHVTQGHLEYESKEEHVPGRSPRPPERWELADQRHSNGGGRRDFQEGPDRECNRVGQKREGHEEDGDDRQIAKLIRETEDRVAAGVEGRAAQEVLPREPVRTEVIPGGQRASHEHRGAECEDRDDDPGGPDETARGHGPVTSGADRRSGITPTGYGDDAPSSVLAVVLALVPLRGWRRQSKEHELRHASPALKPVAARIEHGQEALTPSGVARVPDRAVYRYTRAEQARAGPRERHEVGRKVHL